VVVEQNLHLLVEQTEFKDHLLPFLELHQRVEVLVLMNLLEMLVMEVLEVVVVETVAELHLNQVEQEILLLQVHLKEIQEEMELTLDHNMVVEVVVVHALLVVQVVDLEQVQVEQVKQIL
tara:strand:+ start:40 stop:399 length:360 start_codon:yes stop_codon:yes gene_type:complete